MADQFILIRQAEYDGRKLTSGGRDQMVILARKLKDANLVPDQIFVTSDPAARLSGLQLADAFKNFSTIRPQVIGQNLYTPAKADEADFPATLARMAARPSPLQIAFVGPHYLTHRTTRHLGNVISLPHGAAAVLPLDPTREKFDGSAIKVILPELNGH